MKTNCKNCGAPLDSKINCLYCDTQFQKERNYNYEIELKENSLSENFTAYSKWWHILLQALLQNAIDMAFRLYVRR